MTMSLLMFCRGITKGFTRHSILFDLLVLPSLVKKRNGQNEMKNNHSRKKEATTSEKETAEMKQPSKSLNF